MCGDSADHNLMSPGTSGHPTSYAQQDPDVNLIIILADGLHNGEYDAFRFANHANLNSNFFFGYPDTLSELMAPSAPAPARPSAKCPCLACRKPAGLFSSRRVAAPCQPGYWPSRRFRCRRQLLGDVETEGVVSALCADLLPLTIRAIPSSQPRNAAARAAFHLSILKWRYQTGPSTILPYPESDDRPGTGPESCSARFRFSIGLKSTAR